MESASYAYGSYKQLADKVISHMVTKYGGYWNCVVGTEGQVHVGRMDTKGSFFTGEIDGQLIVVYDIPSFWWYIFGYQPPNNR